MAYRLPLSIVTSVLTLGASTLMTLSPAQAADLSPIGFRDSGTSDFSGISLGVDGGVGLGSAGNANTSGMIGGLHLGYTFQANRLIGGAEVDTMTSNVSTGRLNSSDFNQKFLSSARVRAGYVFADLVAYGTIGYGYSTSAYRDASGLSHATLKGSVYGAGAEYSLTRSISVRAEILRYDFGNKIYATNSGDQSLSTNTNLVRAGLGVRF